MHSYDWNILQANFNTSFRICSFVRCPPRNRVLSQMNNMVYGLLVKQYI